MKCPKCGGHIPDGRLYCESCGHEISIVPEFDPEVENRIDESLSGVADMLKNDIFRTRKLPKLSGEQKTRTANADLPGENGRDYLRALIMAFAIILVAVIFSFLVISVFHAGRDSEERAQEYYVEGKLDKAIELILKEIDETDPEDAVILSDLYFTLYEYRREAGLDEEAIEGLKVLLDEKRFDSASVRGAFDELVTWYDSRKDYDAIYELLKGTDDPDIKARYAYYIPEAPGFYPEEGEYDSSLEVVMFSGGEGDIYYTINGDEPDAGSLKYEDSIVLEEIGDYSIKAVTVNNYGLKSDTVSAFYSIIKIAPKEPEVMEESGEYTQSTMIVAVSDEDCHIFYTNDGSDPTTASTLYTAPISMPLGNSVFKFVAADADGNLSDVVTREYHLSYPKLVSVDEARSAIISTLIRLDILLDGNGTMRGEDGHFEYMYDGDIVIDNSGEYYKFVENHVYNDGTVNETGLLYAVNSRDGKVNRLGYDSSGNYTLITISNR